MKKLLIITWLFIISILNSYGQWYDKNYHVSNINLLSKEQLEESLDHSKTGLIFSVALIAVGGIGLIATTYYPQPIDDPTFIEQLIGDKGMNSIYQVISGGLLVGGTIGSMTFLWRNGRIKSTLAINYPPVGSLNISPTLLLNNYTGSFHPGITLAFHF